MDLTETIIPRSDQLNSEDLLTGPRTVTITEVRKGASAEQPVDIVLAEFGNGRPFKPSKTVRRILVAAWGKEANVYTGRRMTLYRDPSVRFGGSEVGGIRVSHLSHIDKPLSLALTETRGKRAKHVVQPLADEPPPPKQSPSLFDALKAAGLADKDAALSYIGDVLGREVTSTKELTADETQRVIDELAKDFEEQS